MKIKSKIKHLCLSAMIGLLSITPVYADEPVQVSETIPESVIETPAEESKSPKETEKVIKNGTLSVDVWIQDDIRIEEGDFFRITYQTKDDSNPQALSIDASKYKEGIFVELPVGEYKIVGIEYTGKNALIEACGYGTFGELLVRGGNSYNEWMFTIGADPSNKMNKLYENVLLRQGGTYVSEIQGQTVKETESESVEQTETVLESIQEGTAVIDTTPVEETAEDAVYKAGYGKSLILKGIPLLILTVGVLGALFVLRKKGKI